MRWPSFPDALIYARRLTAAALAGGMLAAALATQDPLWWLIFVALIPLEWAIRTVRPLEGVGYGFVTFYVFLSVNLWWLSRWGADKVLGLTFMEAMAYAFMVGFYTWLKRRLGHDPWHLLLPACLVLVEFKRNIGLWAFPWPMLGHALVYQVVLLQFAALVGVMGLSFIVIWANAVLASLWFDEVRPPEARWAMARPFLLTLIAMAIYGNYSLLAAPWIQKQQTPIPATVVQRVTGTLVQWIDPFIRTAMQEYETLTREQLIDAGLLAPAVGQVGPPPQPARQPGLVVWPENAIPKAASEHVQEEIDRGIQRLADESQQVIIYGTFLRVPAGSPEPGRPGAAPLTAQQIEENTLAWQDGAPMDAYNSVEVRVPGGIEAVGTTSKYHLVPFGESVPLKRYLSIVDNPWGSGDNITAAKSLQPFDTPLGSIGVVVCYESFFAPIVRSLVKQGAEILVLTSNTSWFGTYVDATYQHAYYDRARAVENRIPFVRAATTGVSSIIDAWGRELTITEPFEGAMIPGEAPRVEGATRTATIHRRYGTTLYTALGDWVVVLSLLGLGWATFTAWFPQWRLLLRESWGPTVVGEHGVTLPWQTPALQKPSSPTGAVPEAGEGGYNRA